MPQELLAEIDRQAKQEHRNRSEILREAIRHYLKGQRQKNFEEQRLKRLVFTLQESAGSWTDETHPEFREPQDTRRLREGLWKADQERLEKQRP
jgi:metal-responsive CopG/Arc/MetJ family transcriptional regulator